MAEICLVTSRHLAYNPRLYKEACALDKAGFSVRVITPNLDPQKARYDEKLMEGEAWKLKRVPAQRSGDGHRRWLIDAVRQRLLRMVPVLQRLPSGTERAYSRHVDALYRTAVAESADLYVAHNLQALPAAAWAANDHDARLGFDAEDFHRGEFYYGDLDKPVHALTIVVEETYLPRCHHVTAASPGIADAYTDALGIERPKVILNVFSRTERSGTTSPEELHRETPNAAISLYWYSQTIGPNRGLLHAVKALPHLQEGCRPVVISLRGSWAEGFESSLRSLAATLGVEDRIRHLDPAPPEQLVERASCHDIGLALEQPVSRNREICVTNKLFAYVLAGLPVVATRTPGQEAICEELPDAATRLCATRDPDSLAKAVAFFLQDDSILKKGKAASREVGEKRYNWEAERERLIHAFAQSLDLSPEEI
jgi:glycosyltransferase involved in cell wall biosynthesis